MRRPGYQDGPGDGDGLLERAEQLALLNEALTAVTDGGRGRTALVLGEAGIGKTALLRRFSHCAVGPARTMWAACDHLFTPRPLGPFLDLAKAGGGRLAPRAGDAARPYDVAAALLAELGSGGTAVVVLEDVHWADEASLDVIRLLARRIEAVPAPLTRVRVGALVVDPGDGHLDRARAGQHLPRLVTAVAYDQAAAVCIPLGGMRRDIGIHLSLQRLSQHPPGTLPHDLIDQRRRAVLPTLVA
jgi:AAA ATPase domain